VTGDIDNFAGDKDSQPTARTDAVALVMLFRVGVEGPQDVLIR
jgi:hypothetical protein